MKRMIVALAVALAATAAHADYINDYVQLEVGAGVADIKDMGDGIWIQQGAPNNKEHTTTPALMIGLTGPIYSHGSFDVRWHADYVYIGEFSASVDGVPDEYYNPVAHQVLPSFKTSGLPYSAFNGHGHIQGVPLMLDFGYTWHGYRLGVEAGPWLYWQTWHESLYDTGGNWDDLSHKTQMQINYAAGVNVSRGPFSVSYRFYRSTGGGNPYPGLATSSHVLMMTYKF